jgi:hypothetical protein
VAHGVIGSTVPPTVHVPTHFYKAVLVRGEPSMTAAWVVPNAAIGESEPLETFEVPLETVERAAGFRLFRGILGERWGLGGSSAATGGPGVGTAAVDSVGTDSSIGSAHIPLCRSIDCVLPKPWSFANDNKKPAAKPSAGA